MSLGYELITCMSLRMLWNTISMISWIGNWMGKVGTGLSSGEGDSSYPIVRFLWVVPSMIR
jgi:hypothetical protein